MAHQVESLIVIGAVQKPRKRGLFIGCITCNLGSNPAEAAVNIKQKWYTFKLKSWYTFQVK